ncbi:hypothetical protein N0V90_005144 [Kalmusia sp. IMI 367209]|nr:hypothetical protein N0V90_005144 [Kalmusia sp. IMI 367209]
MASRQQEWFISGEGLSREVIDANIQRYLGPDALVRPGEHDGVQGYWITAQRPLTPEMIQDLRTASQRPECHLNFGVPHPIVSLQRHSCNVGSSHEWNIVNNTFLRKPLDGGERAKVRSSSSSSSSSSSLVGGRKIKVPQIPQKARDRPRFDVPDKWDGKGYKFSRAREVPEEPGEGHRNLALSGFESLFGQRRDMVHRKEIIRAPEIPDSPGKAQRYPELREVQPERTTLEVPSPTNSYKQRKKRPLTGASLYRRFPRLKERYLIVHGPQSQSTLTRKQALSEESRNIEYRGENWVDNNRESETTIHKIGSPKASTQKIISNSNIFGESNRGNHHELSDLARRPSFYEPSWTLSTERETSTPINPKTQYTDESWDRFKLATMLERFIVDQLTDELFFSDFLSEGSEQSDTHANVAPDPNSGSCLQMSTDGNAGKSTKKRSRRDGKMPVGDQGAGEDDSGSDSDGKPPRKRTANSLIAQATHTRGLSQHLKRKHWQPQVIECLRCQDTFKSNEGLQAHLNADERCPKRDRISDDRISDDRWKEIVNYKPREYNGYSVEKKWQYLYKALFPNDRRAPSAYARPVMISHLQDPLTASIEEVLADEWGPIVRATFHSLIADLRTKMPAILQKTQEKMDSRNELPPLQSSEIGSVVSLQPTQPISESEPIGDLTNDASNPLNPSLSFDVSTVIGGEPMQPDFLQTDNRPNQNSTLRPPPNLASVFSMDDTTIDPASLGIMDFNMDIGSGDPHWNDLFGGPMLFPQATLTAAEGHNDDSWGT